MACGLQCVFQYLWASSRGSVVRVSVAVSFCGLRCVVSFVVFFDHDVSRGALLGGADGRRSARSFASSRCSSGRHVRFPPGGPAGGRGEGKALFLRAPKGPGR